MKPCPLCSPLFFHIEHTVTKFVKKTIVLRQVPLKIGQIKSFELSANLAGGKSQTV